MLTFNDNYNNRREYILYSILESTINKIFSFTLMMKEPQINFDASNFLKNNKLSFIDSTVIDNLDRKNRFLLSYNFIDYVTNSRMFLNVLLNIYTTILTMSNTFAGAEIAERETFDMFGIFFQEHKNLRRLLTDYSFSGNPLKKDFPLSGFLEISYSFIKKSLVFKKVELAQEFRGFSFQQIWILLFIFISSFLLHNRKNDVFREILHVYVWEKTSVEKIANEVLTFIHEKLMFNVSSENTKVLAHEIPIFDVHIHRVRSSNITKNKISRLSYSSPELKSAVNELFTPFVKSGEGQENYKLFINILTAIQNLEIIPPVSLRKNIKKSAERLKNYIVTAVTGPDYSECSIESEKYTKGKFRDSLKMAIQELKSLENFKVSGHIININVNVNLISVK